MAPSAAFAAIAAPPALDELCINTLRFLAVDMVQKANSGHPGLPMGSAAMARTVAAGKVDRGIALCGSGVGASICANKVAGVRAGLIHDVFSAHQGVEDDDMNVFTLGGQVIGPALAWELIQMFLKARFSGAIRHQRRVDKVSALEIQPVTE